jgi:hypothetical protein
VVRQQTHIIQHTHSFPFPYTPHPSHTHFPIRHKLSLTPPPPYFLCSSHPLPTTFLNYILFYPVTCVFPSLSVPLTSITSHSSLPISLSIPRTLLFSSLPPFLRPSSFLTSSSPASLPPLPSLPLGRVL